MSHFIVVVRGSVPVFLPPAHITLSFKMVVSHCMYTCKCTHAHTRTRTTHACTLTHTNKCTRAHIARTHARTHAHSHARTLARMYDHTHTRTHARTHTAPSYPPPAHTQRHEHLPTNAGILSDNVFPFSFCRFLCLLSCSLFDLPSGAGRCSLLRLRKFTKYHEHKWGQGRGGGDIRRQLLSRSCIPQSGGGFSSAGFPLILIFFFCPLEIIVGGWVGVVECVGRVARGGCKVLIVARARARTHIHTHSISLPSFVVPLTFLHPQTPLLPASFLLLPLSLSLCSLRLSLAHSGRGFRGVR